MRWQSRYALCLLIILAGALAISACQPVDASVARADAADPAENRTAAPEAAVQGDSTPMPTRPTYNPGELVDYLAQTGDTLEALAVRFNTSVAEIRAANPIIPEDATTMPPGLPMKIPIYYLPLWGSPYQILPDSLFVDGPAQTGFDVDAFIASQPGWLKNFTTFASGTNRSAAQAIELVAQNFSVSSRLLLALLEYQGGALSQPDPSDLEQRYPLQFEDSAHRGAYLQLVWAANTLNDAYYRYRSGDLRQITRRDGTLERPDPWQNAATMALHDYFARIYDIDDYTQAIGPQGFAQTYRDLFGDPWAADQPHLPGSLRQPEFALPFERKTTWALTGGPHTGWGSGQPYAALDFAPPSVVGGCVPTQEWATAVAPGVVVRIGEGILVLDLDGDGDERTGWVVFYLHLAAEGRAPLGAQLQAGDPVGHPSCEGGSSTGTHVHIARKYNGEWILASGPLAFNLEGWIAHNGAQAYFGTLTRFSRTVTACTCSNQSSFITAEEREPTPSSEDAP